MRSLRFRLTVWFSLAVTITAGIAAWIGYVVLRQQILDGIDFLLDAEVQEIRQRMAELGSRVDDEAIAHLVAGHTEIDAPLYYFQIHRAGRGVVFHSRNLGDATLPEISTGAPTMRTVTLHDEPAREIEVPYFTYRIQVATNLEQTEALLDRYEHSLFIGLPLIFVVSLGTGWLFSTVALRPVGAMQRAARRIGATNLTERLPVPPGRDEIADLARLLNDLFARLETAFDQVKRFTADASHELKTPLSLIRLHAERLAGSGQLGPAERGEIDGQLEEITRLNKLVENLLLLARADAGGLALDRRRMDSAAFIREVAEDAAALGEDCGRRFALARNDAGEAEFDPGMLRQVMLNILANALRHTPSGRSVTLESRILDRDWEIVVHDEGPGVPPDQIEAIFKRFVRGPAVDVDTPNGSGLGLAIVRGIVEAHHGSVRAQNRPGGGLDVIVRLPAERHASSP